MEKMFNWISIIVAAIGGWLTSVYGGFDGIMIALAFLVIADYLTGLTKAILNRTLSSEIGYKGIVKKLFIFVVVAAACILQENVLSNAVPLREITIMFYIANEGISLLENAAEFIPIPQKLKDILLQLREKNEIQKVTDEEGNEI